MSKKAKRDYLQIEANMREIRRYQKSLDNQTILARCNCSHCITGECMAIKPSNNITTLPDGRKVVDVTCGICGKKVTFTKFTDEQFQEAMQCSFCPIISRVFTTCGNCMSVIRSSSETLRRRRIITTRTPAILLLAMVVVRAICLGILAGPIGKDNRIHGFAAVFMNS